MSAASQSEVLAEETHSAPAWSLLLLLGIIGSVTTLRLLPAPLIRGTMIVGGLLMLGAAAMAWSGFHYQFLRHGVEIRTLGFRVRAIPKQSIVSYSIESWSLIRGYGIRGIGNRRAYVWGNKVVHIKTSNGDVFLGHSDPDRIVRDLDMVMGVPPRS